MSFTAKNIKIEKTTEAKASPKDTLEISPNKASSNSGSGTIKNPIAKEATKIMPTNASVGNEVLISNSQINKIPISKNKKAPKETFKPKSRAKPMPGKATWPKASPTKAILFVSIKEPKSPAAPPIKIPAIKLNKSWLVIIKGDVGHPKYH